MTSAVIPSAVIPSARRQERRFLWLEVPIIGVVLGLQLALIDHSEDDGGVRLALSWATAVLAVVPALLYRRAPVAALALLVVGVASHRLVGGGGVLVSVGLGAVPVLVAITERQVSKGLAALGLIGVTWFVTTAPQDAPTLGELAVLFARFAIIYLLFLPLFGRDVRRRLLDARAAARRADDLDRERRLAVDAAIRSARAQIARDVHDIVAHSMSVVTSRLAIARRLAPTDPEFARASVALVHELTSDALGEISVMAAALDARGAGDTHPEGAGASLDRLPELVAGARDAGHDIDVEVRGTLGDLPDGVATSMFRVLQEALTNARRHAPASRVRVSIVVHTVAVEMHVENGPPRTPAARIDRSGFGLVGMQERVATHGGVLTVGPMDDGGFGVHLLLPLR